MDKPAGTALYVVRTWVPEDQFDEWNRWHGEVHVPAVVAASGARRARRYRVTEDSTPGEWPAQYVTIYEFDSVEAFESYRSSDAAAQLRQDYEGRYGATGKIARQVLVQTSEIS